MLQKGILQKKCWAALLYRLLFSISSTTQPSFLLPNPHNSLLFLSARICAEIYGSYTTVQIWRWNVGHEIGLRTKEAVAENWKDPFIKYTRWSAYSFYTHTHTHTHTSYCYYWDRAVIHNMHKRKVRRSFTILDILSLCTDWYCW